MDYLLVIVLNASLVVGLDSGGCARARSPTFFRYGYLYYSFIVIVKWIERLLG